MIVFFHLSSASLDVDNIVKPILDAMSKLVYEDDRLVSQIIVRKTPLPLGVSILNGPPSLISAVKRAMAIQENLVYIQVRNQPDHQVLP